MKGVSKWEGKSVRHPPHVPCLFSYILEGYLLGSKCRHNTYPYTIPCSSQFLLHTVFSISYIYCAVPTTRKKETLLIFLALSLFPTRYGQPLYRSHPFTFPTSYFLLIYSARPFIHPLTGLKKIYSFYELYKYIDDIFRPELYLRQFVF